MNKDILLPGMYPQTELFSLITEQVLNGFYGNCSVLLNIVTQLAFKLALINDEKFQQTTALLIGQCDESIARNCNNEHALFLRGLTCQYGIGVKVNRQKAIEFYQRAIKRNNAWAMNNQALMHQNACGDPEDCKQAAESLFRKAVELNNPEAMYNLAIMCIREYHSRTYNNQYWIKLLEHAIELRHSGAMCELADVYATGWYEALDYRMANYLREQAIRLNDSRAMVDRAYSHNHGLGGRINHLAANNLLERAIVLDDPRAMADRACAHNRGLGGPINRPAAINLLERAIARNNYSATIERARMYQDGEGGPIDPVAAVKLYEQTLRKLKITHLDLAGLYEIDIRAIAEPLLACLWLDLLAGRDFSEYTLSALRDYCDPKAVVRKIINDNRGSNLIFLNRLLANSNHPLRVIIERSALNLFIRAITDLNMSLLVSSFEQAISSDEPALTMLKKHARNVSNTQQLSNNINPNRKVASEKAPLAIKQYGLTFFHPEVNVGREAQSADNRELEMPDFCSII